ncbi:MAG: hypothetical protein C4575_00480 [Desulforudis sp.]|jgi:hypothetical protein|nr:hypothetical protein [Clostridia bacterium]MDQ7791791.1 hypothetical protein [Clostridia bacterium]RJX22945.1 MAG: hypothetical protein C4575_00480 [Desulforudis sp.]
MDVKTTLTSKEKQFLGFIRDLGWGEVKVLVQNGEPVLIYESIKTVRLDDEDVQLPKQHRNRRPKSTVEVVK